MAIRFQTGTRRSRLVPNPASRADLREKPRRPVNSDVCIRGETPVSTVETEAALIYSGSGKFSPLFSEGQFVFTEFRKATESQS